MHEGLRIDTVKRLLYFGNDCMESLASCGAICCREWNVLLTANEAASAAFVCEEICLLNGQLCRHSHPECFNRRVRLQKKTDGACFYLSENSTCSIYDTRPEICRRFSCQGGWRLQSVASSPGASVEAESTEGLYFSERLRPELIFSPNPQLQFKAVVYVPEVEELVLIARPSGRCGVISAKKKWHATGCSEEILTFFIKAVDGRTSLGQLCQAGAEKFGASFDLRMVYALTWLFFEQNLIVFNQPGV